MALIKIDLSQKLFNVRGDPIKSGKDQDLDIRELLSGFLLGETGAQDTLKNWRMAREIYGSAKPVIEMAESDIEFIEAIIKKSQDTVTIKGQVLEFIMKAKLESLNKQHT